MNYIASFDIGTTNVKGVLVDANAGIHLERNVPLSIRQDRGLVEQDPESWYLAVADIAKGWLASGIEAKEIGLIAFSGQMQDCIPVDEGGIPLRPAILYSDGRGGEQARRLLEELGNETIRLQTENHMDGTLTFPKILWLKDHEPELYERTRSFLVSAKDYVIAKLTGAFVTDPTTAATAGCMDIRTRTWIGGWFDRFGIDPGKMPSIRASDDIAGVIHSQGERETGFAAGTQVLCGIGDAGAATLGAGVYEEGDVYAYIGTTGWVAAPLAGFMDARSGAFNLAYVEQGRQIAIAPMTNAGSAHHWAAGVFGRDRGPDGHPDYASFEQAIGGVNRGNNGVLFLPYLNGERCPVQDADATGCFVGLRPDTTREEMGAAVLEGVALAMRELTEQIVRIRENSRVTLIGGGAKSKVWCRIMADVLQCELAIPEGSQYLPSIGAAMLGFSRAGWGPDYAALCAKVKTARRVERYEPDRTLAGHYEHKFGKYKQLYPALAPLFPL